MILITGGNGQLGTELRHLLDERGMAYTATDAKELDITDKVAVDTFFDKNKPELVYHCAAYTAVDKAEDEGRELDEKSMSMAQKCGRSSCTRRCNIGLYFNRLCFWWDFANWSRMAS